MKREELLERLRLESRHFNWEDLEVPIVEPGLYNTLGKRLFDIYQKYQMDPQDQREVESICFVLLSFIWQREKRSEKSWRRWIPWMQN